MPGSTGQAGEDAQREAAQNAPAGSSSGILNVHLTLGFEPFPCPPRPVFFRQTALVVKKVFFPPRPALFGNHHSSIISYDIFNSQFWTARVDSLHSLLAEAIFSPAHAA